jgi:hypothetical protein
MIDSRTECFFGVELDSETDSQTFEVFLYVNR